MELTRTKRGDQWAWVKLPGHQRNEPLDCRDYAIAGLKIINPDMDAVERRLKGLEEQPKPTAQRRPRTKRIEQITVKRDRLALYLKREAEMLDGGVQSYGIGSRNLARYNTDLSAIRAAIKELEKEIADLEGELSGQRPRKAVGVVPRDW